MQILERRQRRIFEADAEIEEPSRSKPISCFLTFAGPGDQNHQPRSEPEISRVLDDPCIPQEHDKTTSIPEPVAGTKRRPSEQTDFDIFKELKRKKDDEESEQKILERRLAELKALQEQFKQEIKELAKGKSKEELIEWMLASMYERDMDFGGAMVETLRGGEGVN